ncbi:hypothetical protein DHB64_17310 [Antarcticibacterium sp. W02-3]|nr:hypothetical protein [Antarcticibacterium sp. W02-3]
MSPLQGSFIKLAYDFIDGKISKHPVLQNNLGPVGKFNLEGGNRTASDHLIRSREDGRFLISL